MQPLKVGHVFVLHFRPKDDVVVSILVQGISLLGSKMLRCVYASVGKKYKKMISLVQESKQQQNTGLCLCELRHIRTVVEGSRSIFESTS